MGNSKCGPNTNVKLNGVHEKSKLFDGSGLSKVDTVSGPSGRLQQKAQH